MNKLVEYLSQPLPVQPYLLRYFSAASSITIFDIGACEAEDSIRYSRLFPQAKIYSFEPLASNFEKARKNIKDFGVTKVQLFNLALSDKNGTAEFYTSSGHPEDLENTEEWNYGNKSSSLLQPGKVQDVFKWLKFKEVTTVNTITLESFCSEHNIHQIDYIHMDVQGAELLVLKGAGKMMEQINSIWLEVEKIELYKNQPLKDEVDQFMKSHGFECVFSNLDNMAGDQFFVKKTLVKKTSDGASVKKLPVNLEWKNKLSQLVRHEKKSFQKSYSQTGEDVIINYIFQCIGIQKPTFIDIGAHHPFRLNNTALFYARGCRGINVEPDPVLFKEFLKHRKEDINLNIGASDREDSLDFYRMSVATMNTFSKQEADELVRKAGYQVEEVQKINVLPINSIIAKYHDGIFPDLLTLDVEGFEENILFAIDFEKYSPKVICVETISFETDGTGVKNTAIIRYLESKGFMVYADTYINTILVQKNLWIRKET